MKMSSWIFLLISALLIISGLFLCNYARSIAPSDEAIDGNYTSEDGQSLVELDYTDMNISTIALALENCEVEVRGGAKEAKVEMLGFRPNTYINSVSSKTLRISNQITITDYLNLDGSGVAFAGVWQTLLSLTRTDDVDEEQKVIVYIPDDFDIKQYSLSFTDCSVRVVNIGGECDLALYAYDSTIEFTQVNASMVDFECENSELSLLNNTFTHLDIKSEGGKFNSNTLSAKDITISGNEGNFSMLQTDYADFELKMDDCEMLIESIYTQGSYQRDITVETGNVYLGDLLIGKEDHSPEDEDAPGTLQITLKNGKVTSRFGSQQLVIEEELPVTAPTTSEETDPPATSEQ